MITRERCATKEELAELLAGRLPPDRFEEALEHIDACHDCAAAATAMQLPGQFAWRLRSNESTSANFAHEPECQVVLSQLLLQPSSTSTVRDGSPLPVESLGSYRLLKWLGSGGMGAVYLAEHQRLKRLSAIKLLPREKLLQSDWLARFNREMTSIAALEHPHVVRAIDAGDQAGWHYLVMEYLDGADLSKVCRSIGQLPIGTACELVRQASLGLAAIHEQGMTHRDIKPSNMFLTRQGSVKLLDLGLVLSGDSPLAADERLTTVGHLMGTLPYMAREQLLDASDVDWRADIYSLGATLFRMLTGRLPLGSAKNLAQTIQAITTNECPKIESLLPDLPRELAALINRMLSHDRLQRPQSAGEVADLLSQFSDASAPQPLIRTTLSQLDHAAESDVGWNTNSLAPLAPTQNGNASRPALRNPSGRSLWIAAGFLPIAFLAGIVITLLTDRGTLVIESEEPGVTLKVTQGDKVIETLKVENQPGVVRLYSGKYIVELVGADGDGFQLSDSQVTVMRGQKQVLHVRKQPLQNVPQPTPVNEKSYQGKTLAHWMEMLDREKDVAMIGQAMQAVALLAETDSEKLAAAKKSLLPARALGGFIISGRPQAPAAGNLSGWYMKEFTDAYAGFLPEPGLEAVIEELETGNQRSAAACFMLLSLYGNKVFGSMFGAEVDVKLSEHITALARNPSGREKLERLDRACEKWIGQTEAGMRSIPVNFRLVLSELLGKELGQQPQLVAWAEKELTNADDLLKATTFVRCPMLQSTALKISKVLEDEYRLSLLLGLLEKTAAPAGDEDERVTKRLLELAEKYPQAVAEAVVAHLERSRTYAKTVAQQTGMGGMGGGMFYQLQHSPQRAELAKRLLLTRGGDALELVRLVGFQFENHDTYCIFSKDDVTDLLRELALRLANDSRRAENIAPTFGDCVAIYLFNTIGLPKESDKAIEAIVAMNCDFPLPKGEHPWMRAKFPFDQFMRRLESDGPTNFLESTVLANCPRQLVEEHPEEFVRAYIKRLDSGNFDPSHILDPIFENLNFKTEPARRLDHQQSVRKGRSDELVAVASVETLEAAHRRALHAFLARPRDLKVAPFSLSRLVYRLIALNQYLRRDIHGEPFVKEGLDLLFARASENVRNPMEVAPPGLLLYYGQNYGYKDIPFELVSAAEREIAASTNEDEIRKFIFELYKSRPAEFCEYFTTQLEQFADGLDELAVNRPTGQVEDAAQTLYGGLRTTNGRWYEEIRGQLIMSETTKERAIQALKRIEQRLPGSKWP